MAIHEIGDNPSYRDLQKFAMNILHEASRVPPGSSTEVEAKLSYWQTQMNVHLTEKLDVAMSAVTTALGKAASSSSADALKALTEAQRMVRVTWGLVAGTVLLAMATFGLVWYTRELVNVEREAVSASEPATEVGSGANP